MNTAVITFAKNETAIFLALLCSLVFHVLLAVVIPNLHFDEPEPEILTVDFVRPQEPPPALPEPTPPEPEVVKPKIEPKLKPQPKPVIKQPIPVVENAEPISEPPPSTPTEVIAVAPKPEAPAPVQTVQVPVPVRQEPPPVNQADIDDARSRYGNSLWGAISKHKKYPKIAAMRNWQGEAIVELELDGNGKLKSKKITQSSGHEVLDKQALEMVEKALPLPTPPEALKGISFTITVPVPFKLE